MLDLSEAEQILYNEWRRKMNYDAVNTSLQDIAQSVTENLILNLKRLCEVESKYANWTKEERNRFGEKEYFASFQNEYKEIIDEIGTEKLKNSRITNAIATPTKYHYLFGEYRGICTMKSSKKVVIEFYYEYGIEGKHQFTLKLEQEQYKIDSVKYGFESNSDGGWYKMSI